VIHKKNLIKYRCSRKHSRFRPFANIIEDNILHLITNLLNELWRCKFNFSENIDIKMKDIQSCSKPIASHNRSLITLNSCFQEATTPPTYSAIIQCTRSPLINPLVQISTVNYSRKFSIRCLDFDSMEQKVFLSRSKNSLYISPAGDFS
jgi:hypothetical protein